jgi:ribosomal protein S7
MSNRNKVYNKSNLLLKFARVLTGAKTKGERIVLDMLGYIKRKGHPIRIFHSVLRKLGPSLKTMPRKIGGRQLFLPNYVTQERRDYFAISFIIKAAKSIHISKMSLAEKMANEMLAVHFNKQSIALGYKKELLKVVEDNRPFLRIRRSKQFLAKRALYKKQRRKQLIQIRYMKKKW